MITLVSSLIWAERLWLRIYLRTVYVLLCMLVCIRLSWNLHLRRPLPLTLPPHPSPPLVKQPPNGTPRDFHFVRLVVNFVDLNLHNQAVSSDLCSLTFIAFWLSLSVGNGGTTASSSTSANGLIWHILYIRNDWNLHFFLYFEREGVRGAGRVSSGTQLGWYVYANISRYRFGNSLTLR